MNETKICTKCKRELPLSEFSRMKNGKNGLRPWCNECNRAAARAWAQANPERFKETCRKNYIKRKEKMKTLAAREREEWRKAFVKDVLGGYTIYILNYPTNKERKYNAVSTAGDVFKTNDKKEFLRFVAEL
mgnify:CR=1 FL=1